MIRKVCQILFFLICILAAGCGVKKKEDRLTHYDLQKPDRFSMPESLSEISGIAFNNGSADTIYAIQDEEGKLFRLAWDVKKQYHSKFGKQGDYEDVSILNGQVLVLKSNGNLASFAFSDAIYEDVDSVHDWKDIIPKGEYEGMYGDAASKSLYIICKNCEADNSKDSVSGYVLHAGDSVYLKGHFTINVEQIKSFTGKVKRGFRPSAIAKNPLTGEWYILSAVNLLLIVADPNWNIKEVCRLNGNRFNQPEGMAFDNKGNLYISNEGDDLSEGNVLKFKWEK